MDVSKSLSPRQRGKAGKPPTAQRFLFFEPVQESADADGMAGKPGAAPEEEDPLAGALKDSDSVESSSSRVRAKS